MPSPVVGRAGELALLAAAVAGLRRGQGAVIHVEGEPGIGKSTLLDETRRRLGPTVTTRSAAVTETDRHRPLGVIGSLLPELTAGASGDGPVDAVAAAIAVVEGLARSGPVAIVADDVQWADDASLVAVRAIGRRAARLGVLVLTAARAVPPSVAATELRRLAEQARRDGELIELTALTPEHLRQLAEQRLGAPPGPRIERWLAATGGNPFLATEVLSGLADPPVPAEGVETSDGSAVDTSDETARPAAVLDRLAARVLSGVDDTDLLLRCLAVTPGGATAEELADVVSRPLADVVAAALSAVHGAILVDTGRTLAFRHELLRWAVARATPPSIARSLARQMAATLLTRRADPERVAACLLAGFDPADPGDVDRLIEVGMEWCDTRPSAAAELLAAALSALPSQQPRAVDVTISLGWALVSAGRAGEVEHLLDERLGPAHATDPIRVQRLRGVAASLTGGLDTVAARYVGADLPRLEAEFDVTDPDVVDAAAELAMLRVSSGQPREAATLLDWVDASPTPASPFRQATVATVRSQVAAVNGYFEDAAAHARAALTLARRDETTRASETTPALALAVALDLLGDAAGSLAVSRGRVAASPVPRWGPPLLQFFSAITLFRRGDWDDALAEVDAGLLAADEADVSMAVFWPFSVGALISTARDRPSDARAWLDRAPSNSSRRPLGGEWLLAATALAAEAAGGLDDACALVEMLVTRAAAADAPAVLINGGGELARLALRAGRSDLAKAIAYELATVAGRTRSPIAAGVAGWADGGVMDDPLAIATAAEQLAGAGRRPEAARANHHAAGLAARRGDVAAARQHAALALATYDDLDAVHWRRQLLAELGDAGLVLRPGRRPRRPTTGWASLTESEAAIVRLVGEGLTNTAIAERRYVSRRTVESHLSRVYTKLGLHTRAELVVAAARRA